MPAKLRLAYFSPVNPVQSGISDYSEELLPALARFAEIDLYLDNDVKPNNPELARQFKVYPGRQYAGQKARYDAGLFHMGNSAAHAYIYRELTAQPGQGILVLHDYVLHHYMVGEYLNHGKAPQYIQTMARLYGAAGEQVAREVIKGKFADRLFDFPMCEDAIEAARAVLVHSQYAKKLIEARFPGKPVGVARMGVPLPPLVERDAARQRLSLPLDQFIISSLGHLNPYKRLDSALWAFRAFNKEFPNSRYILVGSLSRNYDVQAMIKALGLEKQVELVGYAAGEKYADYLAASDVCLNLRYPTAGETSASLLRIMGAGRPVLVSRTGSFTELPDNTCIKVDVDDNEEELILEYLRLLARRPELALELGQNARRYVAEQARLGDAAYEYYTFLCGVLGRQIELNPEPAEQYRDEIKLLTREAIPASGQIPEKAAPGPDHPEGLLQDVAQAMAELGLGEASPSLGTITQALKDLS